MNICSEKHDEIVHEGKNCPVCDLIDQVEGLQVDVNGRGIEIDDLNKEISELERQLRDCESGTTSTVK